MTKTTNDPQRLDTKSFGKIYKALGGIGRKISRIAKRIIEVTNKNITINPADWEVNWSNPYGQGPDVRPQCEDFEYQFEIGDLVKIAHGFYHGKLQPGDIGVVTKKIVMYSTEVRSDGPAYKIAWQKPREAPPEIREFKLVPAKRK